MYAPSRKLEANKAVEHFCNGNVSFCFYKIFMCLSTGVLFCLLMSFFEKVLHTSIRKKPSSNCSRHYKAIELNDVPIMDGRDNMSGNPRTSSNKFKCDTNECDWERKVCGELNESTSSDSK